jgi:subtilisin family serine protease
MRKLHKSSYYRILAVLLVTAMLGGLLPFTPVASAQTPPAPQPNTSDRGISRPNTKPDALSKDATISPALLNAKGRVPVMLQLADEPAAVVYARTKQQTGDEPQLANATRNQVNKIKSAQTDVLNNLNRLGLKNTNVLYQVNKAYNGIALVTDAANVAALAKLPGVTRVSRLETHQRTNASSVPFIGTPTAWESFGITGTNIRIGVIDTGIDYFHTNFGGPGTVRTTRDQFIDTVITDTVGLFPGNKVAGGFDFAGDAYNADPDSEDFNPVPAPDPDPVDCPSALGGGHGSHVAGTAAGLGVNADGSTYTGAYNASTPFNTMRIGPGTAPGAKLYGLRVFGCNGSTNLVELAIDWALDPNGDDNMSDKLDVVNQSLGSDFGKADSVTAVATNNAAGAGILMVVSAGNANDVSYVNGSPGSAPRALTVASSVDELTITDGFRVNSPAGLAGPHPASFSGAFPWAITNTIPITLNLVYAGSISAANADGCTAWTPAQAAQINGKALLVDWAPAGTSAFLCGSVTRGNNAAAAGAKGVIMRGGFAYLDTAITGASTIPNVYTTLTVGEALKTALGNGNVSVTFSYEYRNSVKLIAPQYNDTISDFTSRGPQGGGNRLKPDIAAPGQTIFSTSSGSGNQGESINGTSMAAPHMAGIMALLKQQHPNWTGEELKALAMNTASHDLYVGMNQTGARYSPVRVGSGRVDVARAVTGTVVAYNADASGSVSVSFGEIRVIGTQTYTRTVKVTNKGNTPATYNISYDNYNDQPGLNYSFSANTIVVPGNGSATFDVVLTANVASMKNIIDPTQVRFITDPTTSFLARQWMSEEMGNILLTPVLPGTILRVPVYVTARPASDIAASPTAVNAPSVNSPFTAELTLQGIGLDTGLNSPTDTVGLTTVYELVHTSPMITLFPEEPESVRSADLKYVGVTSNARYVSNPVTNTRLTFAVASHKDWSTAAWEAEFDVALDFNGDEEIDAFIYNNRRTLAGDATDVMVTTFLVPGLGSLSASYLNGYSPTELHTAIFNNNVLLMDVPVEVFEFVDAFVNAKSTRFNFKIFTFSSSSDFLVDETPWISYDYAKPGVSASQDVYYSLNDNNIPVDIKGSDLVNGSGGILLFHHHNVAGKTTQVVPINNATCGTDAALVTKTNNDGQCGSLNFALNWAQSTTVTNPQVIFNLPANSVYTLTAPIVITQPTLAGKQITIDGGVSIGADGFGVASTVLTASTGVTTAMQILANNVTVKGFQVRGFSNYAVETMGNGVTLAAMYLYGNGVGIKLGTAADPADNTKLGVAGDKSSSNFIYQNTGPGVLVDKGTAIASYLYSGYRLDGSKAANAVGVKVLTGGKLVFDRSNRIAS